MDVATNASWEAMSYVVLFMAIFIPSGYLLEYVGGKMNDLLRKRRLHGNHSLALARTVCGTRDTQSNTEKTEKRQKSY
tara:strand:- start:128 stop:361 length:234 start_codon:yes stop_codon:yes gene_type:complete